MPLIFISYKRGIDGTDRLREELLAEGYAVWFDKEDIRVGDQWQESIHQGILRADAFVLCLSPEACASPYVQQEVTWALERIEHEGLQRNFIFPIVLKPLTDITAQMQEVGLHSGYHVEDLDEFGNWEVQFGKLIKALGAAGIVRSSLEVSRKEKDYENHRLYWRKIREQLRPVDLEDVLGIAATPHHKLPVESLYVPTSTDLRLVTEVIRYDVSQSWLIQDARRTPGERYDRLQEAELAQLDAAAAQIEPTDPVVELVMVQNIREELAARETDEQFARLARLDAGALVRALTAQDAAASFKRLILVGESGSGKTCFAKALLSQQAGRLEKDPLPRRSLDGWPHAALNPVYVDMEELAAHLGDDPNAWNAEHLFNFVCDTWLAGSRLESYREVLQAEFEAGAVLLVIDSVDRAFADSRVLSRRVKQVGQLLHSLDEIYPDIRIVLLMRPLTLPGWPPDGFTQVALVPLAPNARRALVTNMLAALEPDQEPEAAAGQIVEALEEYDAALGGNPRFVALLAMLREARYGHLYEHVVRLLLAHESGRWAKVLADAPRLKNSPEAYVLDFLSQFAYESVKRHPQPDVPGSDLAAVLYSVSGQWQDKAGSADEAAALRYVDVEQLMYEVAVHSGLLAGYNSHGHTDFRFTHPNFRLYLAAEYMLKHDFLRGGSQDDSEAPTALRRMIESYPDTWSEVCRVVGDLIDDHRDRINFIDDMVDDVSPDVLALDDPVQNGRCYSAWLGGRVAVDQDILERIKNDDSLRRSDKTSLISRAETKLSEVINWLRLIAETPGAPHKPWQPGSIDHDRRLEIGRLLGRLGDPRPGVGLREDGLPDILWQPVPAEAEKPAFLMARYPVTVAQYAAFVQANGYAEPRFWPGWRWDWLQGQGISTPRAFWSDDPFFHIPNQPVVGISWFEAQAFCLWLASVLPEARGVRLPSEAEWQRAACGPQPHDYPYGGEYQPEWCNGRFLRVTDKNRRPSVVGLFQQSDSIYHISDLCGNVYEWCADSHPEDIDLPEDSVRRALRGGSWKSSPGFLKVTARYWDYPDHITNYWGFRLVRDAE